jgi:glutamate 5-kinase
VLRFVLHGLQMKLGQPTALPIGFSNWHLVHVQVAGVDGEGSAQASAGGIATELAATELAAASPSTVVTVASDSSNAFSISADTASAAAMANKKRRRLSRACELLQAADYNEVMQGGCHRW